MDITTSARPTLRPNIPSIIWAWMKACSSNIRMEYYEAGHMMYIHMPSLKKLKTDLVKFIQKRDVEVCEIKREQELLSSSVSFIEIRTC